MRCTLQSSPSAGRAILRSIGEEKTSKKREYPPFWRVVPVSSGEKMPRFRVRIMFVLLLLGTMACSKSRPLSPELPGESYIHEPWDDAEAENLAWLISGQPYAPQQTYDRIKSDLAFIRERWGDSLPDIRVVKHVPWSEPRIDFSLDADVRDEMVRGDYHDWDSLNVFFAAEVRNGPVILSHNRVNPWRMMQAYEALRGVQDVWPSTDIGQRPNIYAFLHPWGIAYVYRRTWGDCPSGCIWNQVHYFRSRTVEIEYVGYWDVDLEVADPPAWWSEAKKCWDLYDLGDAGWRYRDTIPPARVTDLQLSGAQSGRSASVSFTAPGDDGDVGRLPRMAYYELCWLPEPVNEDNWDPQNIPSEQRPLARFPTRPPGEIVILTLDRLRTDTLNYIGLITVDQSPLASYKGVSNRSAISNLVISRITVQ